MSPLVRRSQSVVVHLDAGGLRCELHGWVDDIDEVFLRLQFADGAPLPAAGDLIDVTTVGVEVRATVQQVDRTGVTVLRPLAFRSVLDDFDDTDEVPDDAHDRERTRRVTDEPST